MLLLINIVTSLFVDVSMQRTLPLIIGSVYDYASQDAHNKTQTTFTTLCVGIEEALSLPIPTNESRSSNSQILTFTESCKDYNAGKIRTRDILTGPLSTLLLHSIESSLNQSSVNSQTDSNLSQSSSTTVTTVSDSNSQKINNSVLKYALAYLQGKDKKSHLAAKIIAIILLFALWFVVSHDLSDYLRSVSRMFFSTGMLVFAVWSISFILVVFYPPDTTSLLLLISGGGEGVQPQLVELLALLPVIVLDLIGSVVLLIAAVSICIAFVLYLIRRYYIDTHPSASAPSS